MPGPLCVEGETRPLPGPAPIAEGWTGSRALLLPQGPEQGHERRG